MLFKSEQYFCTKNVYYSVVKIIYKNIVLKYNIYMYKIHWKFRKIIYYKHIILYSNFLEVLQWEGITQNRFCMVAFFLDENQRGVSVYINEKYMLS